MPPLIDKVGCFNETSLSTLDAIVVVHQSIEVVAPKYDIPFDKFKAIQANLFGPQRQGRHATDTNEEQGLISRCDVTTKALIKQDIVE